MSLAAPRPGAGPVLVVGASLARATAAAALREAGYSGPLTLLGAEDALPYERPALSKTYLTGATTAPDLLVHPTSFYAKHNIELRLGQAAAGLDVDRRRVGLASGEQVGYGTLVIATGAGNVRPPIPGIDLTGVHQLRTLSDADALRAAARSARTAVVVGMGFIGCEVTATLRGLGLAVTAVDAMPGPLWGPLGPELSAVARHWHEQHGVRVLTGQSVAAFTPDPTRSAVAAVELTSGERLFADLVVVGVGVRPTPPGSPTPACTWPPAPSAPTTTAAPASPVSTPPGTSPPPGTRRPARTGATSTGRPPSPRAAAPPSTSPARHPTRARRRTSGPTSTTRPCSTAASTTPTASWSCAATRPNPNDP